MEQSATTVNSAWNRSRLQYGTTVACNHNTCNPIPPSSRGGRVDAVDAVVTVPAAPAALPMLTVLPPALPLPPSSHNRMPPHAATRHQHTTPTPRQVRAGHYRCCSRRRRWGRSEEYTSELQSREKLVCRLLLEKKKKKTKNR